MKISTFTKREHRLKAILISDSTRRDRGNDEERGREIERKNKRYKEGRERERGMKVKRERYCETGTKNDGQSIDEKSRERNRVREGNLIEEYLLNFMNAERRTCPG